MKRIVLIISVCCAALSVMAQYAPTGKAKRYFRFAEKEYSDQRYMFSIPFYQFALTHRSKNDSLGRAHLAEAYWQVKNYDSALSAYLKFESKYKRNSLSAQRIAELYANHQQYGAAVKTYRKILEDTTAANSARTTLMNERIKGFLNINTFQQDSADFYIQKLNLNTQQQDFSPQFLNNGLVFVSNRFYRRSSVHEFGWDGLPYSAIYWVKDTAKLSASDYVNTYTYPDNRIGIKLNADYTPKTSNDNDIILKNRIHGVYAKGAEALSKFSDNLSGKYNYGPVCFNPDGTKVYFTRNTLSRSARKRYNLEICEATFTKGQWGNVHVMPFVQGDYDFFHPALSSDGMRLYFCSNKPGGMGGSDIYYVSLTAEFNKELPINFSEVNTAGDELFPAISGDTLFFSSNGLSGLGGLDIYKIYLKKGNWTKPANMGYPVNSSYDDFGMVYNAAVNKGYFSSNRLGSDDIFSVVYASSTFQLSGTVLNRANQRRMDSVKMILRSTDNTNPHIDSFVTDLTGNFKLPVKPGSYTVDLKRNGFRDTTIKFVLAKREDLLLDPLSMQPNPIPVVVVIEKDTDGDGVPDSKDKCPTEKGTKENFGCPNVQVRIDELAKMVYFKTASAELSPAAFKPLNEVADIMLKYSWITLSIEGHTDSVASLKYNMDLSSRRANAVRQFFIEKGLSGLRFTSVGYGPTRPIADNKTPEGRALNRRVLMKADFHSRTMEE